jgi:pilus assembly protein CpaC
MGFDFATINGNDFAISGVAGLISRAATQAGTATGNGDTIRFGVVDGNNSFFGFLEALRRNNMVKILAEPTLVTISGRPASFNAGGEFPILIPSGLGTTSIQFKEFGTRVDFVPIVLGNGNIRLETRPQVSEVDEARGVTINNITVPGLRSRWVDTAVEMKAGQTLALAGLIQQRTESEVSAVPWLGELPWIGAAFRRTQETMNEIELLIVVRPELVDALDPHEVPPCGPGELTTSPGDVDLFWRGYNEVPKCCSDGSCPQCRARGVSYGQPVGPPLPHQVGPNGAGASMQRQPPAQYATANRTPAHFAPAPASGVTVRPVIGPTQPRIPNNPYGGNNPAPVVVAPDGRGEPEYFGPRGYDVIDYKRK